MSKPARWLRALVLIAVLILALPRVAPAAAPPAGAPPGPPPPPKNLQFFPKSMSRQEVVAQMRQICFGLGVRCDYCHVQEEGPNGREDFASDEKPTKVKARAMMQLTRQINDDLLARIQNRSTPAVTVSCVTCHHGNARPETLTERLNAAAAAGGGDSAVAELRLLRDKAEFGRFNVSEWGVNEAARGLASAGKRKEALALLQANAGYHPESTAIPGLLAEMHLALGDTTAAVDILKRLLATDPQNRRVKAMLDRITGVTPPAPPR